MNNNWKVLVWLDKTSEPIEYDNAIVYETGSYTCTHGADDPTIDRYPTDHIFRIRWLNR